MDHVVGGRGERRLDRQAGGAHGHGTDDSSASGSPQSGTDPELDPPRPSLIAPSGALARQREGFARSRVATNMVRASSGRAVSHLHVVATQSVTASDAAPLIERAVEIEVLDGVVRSLAEGEGGVVVLDAPAGLGKTALLEHAALTAAEAGCLVRRADPGPLERHFPFGVARALIQAPRRDAAEEDSAQLLDGAAAPAGTLLLDGTVPSGDS